MQLTQTIFWRIQFITHKIEEAAVMRFFVIGIIISGATGIGIIRTEIAAGGTIEETSSADCAPLVWPKTRACAIQLGAGQVDEGYTYNDGTGTWVSSCSGSQKLVLEEALKACAGSCTAIVFNGGQPGDTGTAYGKYCTCWKPAATGLITTVIDPCRTLESASAMGQLPI